MKTSTKEINKVVRLGTIPDWRNMARDVFCKVTYTDGKLSISGVEGPKPNGDCHGSCGQIEMSLEDGQSITSAPGWTPETIKKFLEVWREWHLNDMRAACEHQRGLGWLKLASEKVTLYEWRLKSDVSSLQETIEKSALSALRAGETFKPTKEQARIARLEYGITTTTPDAPPEYEPKKPLWNGDRGHTEEKTLGWLTEKEHPQGILSKACPTCGYKYGSAWLKEEVPVEVLEWIESLPDTDKKPAWV